MLFHIRIQRYFFYVLSNRNLKITVINDADTIVDSYYDTENKIF